MLVSHYRADRLFCGAYIVTLITFWVRIRLTLPEILIEGLNRPTGPMTACKTALTGLAQTRVGV
jgi:hypothetical protein